MVCQDHITLSVEFYKNVVGVFPTAEAQVDDSIDSELSEVFELFGSQVLPKLHGKA